MLVKQQTCVLGHVIGVSRPMRELSPAFKKDIVNEESSYNLLYVCNDISSLIFVCVYEKLLKILPKMKKKLQYFFKMY